MSDGVTLCWPDRDRIPEPARTALIGPGAPFELVVEDVLGAPMEVFARRAPHLPALLSSAAERFAERPYVVFHDHTYTYGGIIEPVARAAAALRERYGIGPGDRVAISAANCAEWALTFWAVTCLGAITVAMNGWWTGAEMRYGLDLTTPKLLAGDRRRLGRLGEEAPGLPVLTFEEDFGDLVACHPAETLPEVPIDEDDPFLILFTSGTTGRPKGAVLSHRSNIHFILASLVGAPARAAVLGIPPAPAEPPRIINAAPMFHVGGLNCQLVMSTVTGATIIYPPPGRWREDVQLELTERHRATNWSMVPTQLWRLLQWPELDRYDLTSLRGVGGGSAVWPPELLRSLEQHLPWVRPGLSTGYGMTETNGLGTSLKSADSFEHPDSIGEACVATEVQVRDPATGQALASGDVGEICLRTAAGFLGYWDNPTATTAALDADRWYRTGDFGRIENGFVHLEGRRRDLIIRGGENIYPVEIENRLLEHPDVDDVAVIGVPHPTLGQEVKAVVVARRGATLAPGEVQRFAGETLASFKVPTIVEARDVLPYNPAGKVMKHLLEQPDQVSGFVQE